MSTIINDLVVRRLKKFCQKSYITAKSNDFKSALGNKKKHSNP